MPRKRNRRKRLDRVAIRAERRSEPDWDRYAWALLQYARMRVAAEQQAKEAKRDKP
jgi:hypothetical protein